MAKRLSLLTNEEIDVEDEDESEVERLEDELEAKTKQFASEMEAAKAYAADCERRMIDAERVASAATRARASMESECLTLSARVEASNTALIQSEGRTLAERTAKEAANARADALQARVDQLVAELDMLANVRAMSEEMRTSIMASTSDLKKTILTAAAQPGEAAPVFELSFSRDSNGRIKSPVTAKPRVQ